MIHGETCSGEEVEQALVLLVGQEAAGVGEGGRVGHVDGDGVTVAERCLGDKLVKRRPTEEVSMVLRSVARE